MADRAADRLGVSVGLTAALQFLPMLLFGAWGGLLADRVPKLRLLQYTQALMALPALTLWALVATGHVDDAGSCSRSCSPAAPCWRSTTPRGSRS